MVKLDAAGASVYDFKKGDLCKILVNQDYGWTLDDLDSPGREEYQPYIPLIEPHTTKQGMIVEIIAAVNFVHLTVWVPELDGYTFFWFDHLQKADNR